MKICLQCVKIFADCITLLVMCTVKKFQQKIFCSDVKTTYCCCYDESVLVLACSTGSFYTKMHYVVSM